MSARRLPACVLAELRRVGALPQPWLVADMDSTLIRKARGEWPDLDESPVRPHLFEWLRTGGSLLVVTSDDGHRPWRSLLGQIPAELRQRVALSTADGAVLARHMEHSGRFTEDRGYWDSAAAGGTGLPQPDRTTELACAIKRDFLCDAMADPELLASVSPAWRRESYADILAQHGGDPSSLAAFLTAERMLGMNAIMRRGSLVWRNRAGEPDFWEVADEEEWRAKRAQKLQQEQADGATGGPRADHLAPRWTNCFVLGMSSVVSAPYITRYSSELRTLGATASAAPNSVLIKRQGTDKGLPIRWLAERGVMGFAMPAAVAFGDNPMGNDGPLTAFVQEGDSSFVWFFVFPRQLGDSVRGVGSMGAWVHGSVAEWCTMTGHWRAGMPFISVAETLEQTPAGLRDFW
jgi:hypothetical protein